MNRTRGWVCWGITLLLVTVLLFTKSGGSSVISAQGRKTTRASAAADLFRTNCARCHGAEGRGDTALGQTYNAPDFTDEAWWRRNATTTTRGKLVLLVTGGKGDMPAFEKKLTPAQIKLLVDYVRRFRGSN